MPTPEPGVPWTSDEPDDMTLAIAARNTAAQADEDNGPEITALEEAVDELEEHNEEGLY